MRLSLIPALLALATFVSAAPYVVTSYVVLSVYTYNGYTRSYTTVPESVYTYTRAVASPTAGVSAISTITTSGYEKHVTIVEVLLPTGQRLTENYASSYSSYVVPITYAPSATCTGQNWTFTTTVPIYVPDIVSVPVTLISSATTRTYAHLNPSATTRVLALVNPTDVDPSDLASASSNYAPYGLSSCYTPTLYCPTAAASTESAPPCSTTFVYERYSSYSGSSSNYYDSDENYWLRDFILIVILVPVGWILIWLIIGMWENWLSFKGLMLGQHRKRGLPYSWCCISIIFLCFVGPTYKAKSPEEQAELLEKWNAMKKREKFKAWMKYGFRWKYPDMIGPEPGIAKRALRQGCL